MLLVRAAHARDQEIVEETLVVEGARVEEGPDDRLLQSSSRLPFALLPWTLPSRYAPSDLLGATAQAELGLGPRARALLPVAAWRLMDATGLAPVETIVRVASGRDAADIAWATGDGALELDDLRVAAANMGPPG